MKKIIIISLALTAAFLISGCGTAKKLAQTRTKKIEIAAIEEHLPGPLCEDGRPQE